MGGTLYHVISYFTEEDLRLGRLPRPTSRRDLMQLVITPDMILPFDFRVPPPIKTGQDGRPYLYVALIYLDARTLNYPLQIRC